MKKIKVILLLAAASLGITCEAQAGLNLAFTFGGHSHHREYRDYGYEEVRYRAPVVHYYESEEYYYRPQRRAVEYYQQPVYYRERQYRRYSNNRCD